MRELGWQIEPEMQKYVDWCLRSTAQINREMLEREFNKGRMFQFNRMKKERPIDPVFWDAHEEANILSGAQETPTQPARKAGE